ncbi:UDP-N-acetylmuramoylalanyl-D-glutamyl-2,6-diaminopimelate--D-alanyl-D-alanine ligase [Futiania mangrovi]|uniref:UDP-N-acetylmuramoyl-tripeptide--D-alanyl-D-alanine ligase n=1 Tax=Futiania mangrovi TaxID=2959716 RepID=A0A9J6P8M8_9PROT|nr:UDP-N-acetylmuramoylalanyl-D-glutamyl-2,6-diaminopimelate--D-alanyl-D-alanine ligase [Futiania mangrovii]MCP1334949.1 UDP-N-acetylmuramoylalanyl-D-glutamyl-2,6-diaminopimelate--D-alanyl-D-alanine ligase [Futiania mangrovii]
MTAPQPLWTSAEMMAATGGRIGADVTVTGVSIDTRTLAPGDLFVALEGENRDGHTFVADALARGAAAAIVVRVPDGVAPDAPLLIVEDTLEGLRALGRAARARIDGTVIGVTGSVGKTSTKEALAAAFGAQGATHAAQASYNNHWGVPLTLARMPRETRFAVIEMGMNHAGEIAPLSRLARPHVAIITTVAPVHLENFADVSGIADAKAEIIDGLEPGGTLLLNADNAWTPRIRDRAQAAGVRHVLTFGEAADADIRAERIALKPETSCIAATVCGTPVTYKLGAPGRHLALNSLAVLGAVHAAGGDLARAALALAGVRPASGRGERIEIGLPGGAALLIDESYNANPTSVGAALDLLAQAPVGDRGRRIAILGDMLELGPEAEALHAGLAEAVARAGIDRVHCAGPLMRALHDALPARVRGVWAQSSADLADRAAADLRPGDAVMVKGSLGSRMARVVEALRARDVRGRRAG